MTKINHTNYFENTKNENFKALAVFPKSKVRNGSKYGVAAIARRDQKALIQKALNLSDEELKNWEFNFQSLSPAFASISLYWVNHKIKQLIRISDHWSISDNYSRIVTECGQIRTCWWGLKITKKLIKANEHLKDRKTAILAITKFKDFELNN